MKNITLLFCLFLANILLGACSGGEDEKKEMDEGKGAYALFLKKSITVSTGESQTDVVVEWAKTSWEIILGEGDIVKSVTPTSGGSNTGGKTVHEGSCILWCEQYDEKAYTNHSLIR